MKFSAKRVFTVVTLASAALSLAGFASAQDRATSGPSVRYEDHHDTSLPARELTSLGSRVIHIDKGERRRPGPPIIGSEPDPVVQRTEIPLVGTANGLNFDGISDRDGVAPPDTNASVGATQVVEIVNTSYQVFNKTTGASVLGPAEINTVFAKFGGVCQSGPYYSDPVVLYDKMAGRWLITIIGSNNGFSTGSECIAVSTTSDATGAYNRYAYSFSPDLNDYPKFGVWPDAYYATYNLFGPVSFVGADACAYDRTAMLAGTTAAEICFTKSAEFSFLPGDMDGAGVATTGEPDFFVDLNNSTSLHLYTFHVDFTMPSNSTFTGPTTITVASYTEACGGGTCIPQPGTTQRLDSLADRLMFRLAYRNFSDHEALVVTHSVAGTGGDVSAARWYEIRSPNATPTVFQQGTFALSAVPLWMGSIGMDKVGDIALGVSASSGSVHPSIGYTGRKPTDPAGMMESPALIKLGPGSQTGGLSRWGDYSSMAIDPADDCTFWYSQMYIPANGSFNWHTRLASFKFVNCK